MCTHTSETPVHWARHGTPTLTRNRSRRASDMRLRVLTRDAVLRADGSAGVLLLPIIVAGLERP